MRTVRMAATLLYFAALTVYKPTKANPYYRGDTLCERYHISDLTDCATWCTEGGYANGLCQNGKCLCEQDKITSINKVEFCETETELECAQHCLRGGFFTGNCLQNDGCVCSFHPTEQDPICTMGGNLTCYMHCHDLAYLSGYCDSHYDCCCSYGINTEDCYIMLDLPPECLPEERTTCEAHCNAQGYQKFLCRNKKCFCSEITSDNS